MGTCVGCLKGKCHRLPFPKDVHHRAKKPLELVHSDVYRPMKKKSIDDDEVTHFGEAVHNREDGAVAITIHEESGDEVQRDVFPWCGGDGEW